MRETLLYEKEHVGEDRGTGRAEQRLPRKAGAVVRPPLGAADTGCSPARPAKARRVRCLSSFLHRWPGLRMTAASGPTCMGDSGVGRRRDLPSARLDQYQ